MITTKKIIHLEIDRKSILFYKILSRIEVLASYANNIDENLSNKCTLIEAKKIVGKVTRKVKYDKIGKIPGVLVYFIKCE